MSKNKPFSRTEMKILVYNKMKRDGMSYEEAVEQVKRDIEQCQKTSGVADE